MGDEEEGRWHFRAQGPFAGVGDHLRWEEDGAHGGYEEDLGLHQEEQPQSGPHDQAGFHPEGHLPGGEHRHAQDGRLRQQAPVVSPWASPQLTAHEGRQRISVSNRLQSWAKHRWLYDCIISWLCSWLCRGGCIGGCRAGCSARCTTDMTLLGPGDSAEEFRRRAGLSSRDLTSSTLLFSHRLHTLTSRAVPWLPLHALWSGGEAVQERRSHHGDSSGSLQDLDFPKFQTF